MYEGKDEGKCKDNGKDEGKSEDEGEGKYEVACCCTKRSQSSFT